MEYLIGIIVALIGGVFYFKGKADKADAGSRISLTKGRDIELADQQSIVEQAILDLEEGIKALDEKRKHQKKVHKTKTLKERAEEANDRYKK